MNIFIYKNDQQSGPFSLDEVYAMLESDAILITDPGWVDGMTDWKPLNEIIPLKQPQAKLSYSEIGAYKKITESLEPSRQVHPHKIAYMNTKLFITIVFAIVCAFLVITFGQYIISKQKDLAGVKSEAEKLRVDSINSEINNLWMQTVYSREEKVCAESFIENKSKYSSLKIAYDNLESKYKNGTLLEINMQDMEVFFNEETPDSIKIAAFSKEFMNATVELKHCIKMLHLNDGIDAARLNESSNRGYEYNHYRPTLAYKIKRYNEMKQIYLSKYKLIVDECMQATRNVKILDTANSITNKITEIDSLLKTSDAENAEKILPN